jgi:DNA-binding transcriptional LysR family regulator
VLFRQLEYLVALADERHFARAAEVCGVSQPSLSEAIRKLEEELGLPLIQRGRRFDGLTAEGERVLTWARRIVADRDGLQAEVEAMRTGLSGRLRVGTVPSAAVAVPRLLEPLCAVHPLLTIEMAADLTADAIAERLRDFSLDAALTYIDDEIRADFHALPLYRERYALLTRADWAGEGDISWADAARLPLCLLTPNMRGRRTVDACFAAADAAPVAKVETDSVAAMIAYARSGSCAGIVPIAWLHGLGVPHGTRALSLPDPAEPVEVGLVTSRRQPEPVAVSALREEARRIDLRELAGGPGQSVQRVRAPAPGG